VKIFQTGASGYLGSAAAEALLRGGHAVTGLARSDASAAAIEGIGAAVCRGDLADFAGWIDIAAAHDAVVHVALAGAAADQALIPVLLAKLKGKVFLYTSGVWVMGNTGDRLAGEAWPVKPPPISAWRKSIETQILDARAEGVRTIVLRPATVYGRVGGVVGKLIAQAKTTGVVKHPGDGKNRKSYVHIDDVADLYALAIERSPAGELYLAADGPALTTSAVLDAIAARFSARVEYIPADIAREQMGPVAEAYMLDQKIGSTKAGRMLGWRPSRPGVLDMIAQA
jgi:nucleoside-diphosphate-sugar epimerase